ncbi:hypothetical protein KP803_14130 [Vibrio sp. ZSDE26]|uniref:Uncharacterized protein n=1 Tax=Vibrio amylolyticus TaxID=2847292 RepID=A0A9X1XNW4_9VIBR|nr:hypothetical protein [Vibrio amylolyticus]MCK6264415.1 hypothetical protein [Vibrio amylolyticus]
MNRLLLLFLLVSSSAFAAESGSLPLKCQLLDTSDHFWFYNEQIVYKSDQFAVFQNFKGRVVTQIDLKTNELIRTTYIGDPFDPEYQILLGKCDDALHVLDMWAMNQLPLDN